MAQDAIHRIGHVQGIGPAKPADRSGDRRIKSRPGRQIQFAIRQAAEVLDDALGNLRRRVDIGAMGIAADVRRHQAGRRRSQADQTFRQARREMAGRDRGRDQGGVRRIIQIRSQGRATIIDSVDRLGFPVMKLEDQVRGIDQQGADVPAFAEGHRARLAGNIGSAVVAAAAVVNVSLHQLVEPIAFVAHQDGNRIRRIRPLDHPAGEDRREIRITVIGQAQQNANLPAVDCVAPNQRVQFAVDIGDRKTAQIQADAAIGFRRCRRHPGQAQTSFDRRIEQRIRQRVRRLGNIADVRITKDRFPGHGGFGRDDAGRIDPQRHDP
jgi:hypothetical protein